VAADRSRLAVAPEELTREQARIADASEIQIQRVPPKALSPEAAAEYLGLRLKSLENLVKTRQIAYVQVGGKRGRVFLIEDLDAFLMKRRQEALEGPMDKRRG